MAKNSSKTINWICAGIAAYFIGITIAGAVKRRKGTSGIGDVPVWNRGHIRNWLAYEHYAYPEKIIVTRGEWYLNDGCVAVWSYTDRDARNWQYQRDFQIRERDIDYLREMCEKHGVKYIEL